MKFSIFTQITKPVKYQKKGLKNKRLFPIHNRQKILFTPFYTKKRVVESGKCNILWDMTIQCDHVIEARRPDIVVVEKENNKAIIVDITSS